MGWTQVIMMILAVITLGTGVVLNQRDTYPEVLSEADMQTPDPTHVASKTPLPTQTALVITPQPSSQPTLTPSTDNNLSSLFYPGATVVSINGSTARLTSSASPDAIFTWYQDQFKSKKLNAISSSKTNVNNNFQAKLAGANGDINIDVEVKKSARESTVAIELNLSQ